MSTCSQECGRRAMARGLCDTCYRRLRYHGQLADHERRTRSRDELMAEWEILRAQGYTRRQAAERLGMSQQAFDRAYFRARQDGDARAVPAIGGERRRAA